MRNSAEVQTTLVLRRLSLLLDSSIILSSKLIADLLLSDNATERYWPVSINLLYDGKLFLSVI